MSHYSWSSRHFLNTRSDHLASCWKLRRKYRKAVVAQWQSTVSSSQRCPWFNSRWLLSSSLIMLGEYFCNMKFVQSNTLAMYVTNLQCPKNANTVVSVVAMTVACSRVARVFHLESHCRVISPLQPAINKHRFVFYPERVTPLAYQKWGVVSDSDIRRTRKEIHNSFRQRVYGRLGTRIFITEWITSQDKLAAPNLLWASWGAVMLVTEWVTPSSYCIFS